MTEGISFNPNVKAETIAKAKAESGKDVTPEEVKLFDFGGSSSTNSCANAKLLLASGERINVEGLYQAALGVGLSSINYCSHTILGKHHNSDWLGHKVCKKDSSKPQPQPMPSKPEFTPEPEAWIDDPTL